MRQYLSEKWIAWGAVLVVGTTCALARGEAPRQGARVVASGSAPATPVGMGMPQTYTPPTAPLGPMGLTALAPSYSAPGEGLAGELLPPGSTPASVNPLAAGEPEKRGRFAFPKLFRKSRESASAAPHAAAPQQAAPQMAASPKPQPAAQSGPAPANRVISTTAPAGPAVAQLVGAQSPAGLPNGPVIICMPAGWQPPAEFSFAPRQVSPEVTEEFWPVSSGTRNPLGSSEPGGMFRWPRFAKDDDAAPAPREAAKAIVTAQPAGAARPSAQGEVDTTPPWKKILMARSNGHEVPETQGEAGTTTAAMPQGPAPSKALFSLSRKPQPAAPAAAPPTAAPAPAPVAQVSAPMNEPARAPAPPAVARREPSASRIPTSVPQSPARLVTDSKNPKLQWRAKGAPRESAAEEADASADGGSRVVAHTEAARGSAAGVPTPADPALDPEHAGEQPPAAPGFEGAPAPQVVGPQPMAATAPPNAAAAPVRSKALIPSSFFSGKPKVPAAPPEPSLQLTSSPQRGAPALVNIVPRRPIPRPMPEIGPAAGSPAAASSAVAAETGNNRALLPKMFVEYSPSQISLSTKPSAVPSPVGMQPAGNGGQVAMQPAAATPTAAATQGENDLPEMPAPPRIARTHRHSSDEDSDDGHDSYYAPPVKRKAAQAERRVATEEPEEEAQPEEREARPPTHFKRSSPHPREFRPAEPGPTWARSGLAPKGDARAARNRSYAAPREIPPLARPFWAISEMTKLPKFVTALTGGGGNAQEPRVTHRAPQPTLARQAAPREAVPHEAESDEAESDEADEAPRTARGRQWAEEPDEMTPDDMADDDGDEIAERPSKRRKHAEADDEPIASKQSTVEGDDEREADEDRPQRKPSPRSTGGPSARRPAEVKVVSGAASAGSSISRSKVVRMRKKDGSSVIVYYVAKQPAEEAGAEVEASPGKVAEPQAAEPPAAAKRRVVRPAADASAKKLRDNPLR